PAPDRLVVHGLRPSEAFNGKEYPGPGGAVTGARESPAAPVARTAIRAVNGLELLQRAPRAHRDAGQWRLRQVRPHLRRFAQPLVQALQQRPTPGEHDAAVHDVRGELRRGAVEGLL